MSSVGFFWSSEAFALFFALVGRSSIILVLQPRKTFPISFCSAKRDSKQCLWGPIASLYIAILLEQKWCAVIIQVGGDCGLEEQLIGISCNVNYSWIWPIQELPSVFVLPIPRSQLCIPGSPTVEQTSYQYQARSAAWWIRSFPIKWEVWGSILCLATKWVALGAQKLCMALWVGLYELGCLQFPSSVIQDKLQETKWMLTISKAVRTKLDLRLRIKHAWLKERPQEEGSYNFTFPSIVCSQ